MRSILLWPFNFIRVYGASRGWQLLENVHHHQPGSGDQRKASEEGEHVEQLGSLPWRLSSIVGSRWITHYIQFHHRAFQSMVGSHMTRSSITGPGYARMTQHLKLFIFHWLVRCILWPQLSDDDGPPFQSIIMAILGLSLRLVDGITHDTMPSRDQAMPGWPSIQNC